MAEKYERADNGGFLKDGHTMFDEDVLKDLKRKSFLEDEIKRLTPNGNVKRIKKMKTFSVSEEMVSNMERLTREALVYMIPFSFDKTQADAITLKDDHLKAILSCLEDIQQGRGDEDGPSAT